MTLAITDFTLVLLGFVAVGASFGGACVGAMCGMYIGSHSMIKAVKEAFDA